VNNPPAGNRPADLNPRTRLFSFVSVKKRWQAADEEAKKLMQNQKIELDVVTPKGRERQETVVFYLNQKNGFKLEQMIEEDDESDVTRALQSAYLYQSKVGVPQKPTHRMPLPKRPAGPGLGLGLIQNAAIKPGLKISADRTPSILSPLEGRAHLSDDSELHTRKRSIMGARPQDRAQVMEQCGHMATAAALAKAATENRISALLAPAPAAIPEPQDRLLPELPEEPSPEELAADFDETEESETTSSSQNISTDTSETPDGMIPGQELSSSSSSWVIGTSGGSVSSSETTEVEEEEGSKKAIDEGEYSSEEEVEVAGEMVVRPRRSQTVQRQEVELPEQKEGWAKKCGVEGYRRKNWQKRYFVLEYPFLDIYDKKGGRRKGRISMRGGILIDEELLDDLKKYKKGNKTSFKISADAKHKLILCFKTEQEKAAWAKAIWSNIYYANPAKRPNGVTYKVTQVNDEKDDFALNTSMSGITLSVGYPPKEVWFQPFNHLRTIVLPEKQVGENWITLDFSKYGGAKVIHLDNVPPVVIYKSFASLFEACTAWQNTSLLKDIYRKKE